MGITHFIFQKKGGAGKSLISTMWFQYLELMGLKVFGIDTDPSNRTFAGFKDLNITEINILNKEKDIDQRLFDPLVESVFRLGENEHLVVDSGSSCFVSLMAYLTESSAFDLIQSEGRRIYIHVPVTGGSEMLHTADCLDELVKIFPNLPFIIWKNQYHGELTSMEGDEIKKFEDFKVYKKNSDHFAAVVEMPQKKKDTFGKDIEGLLAKKLTFKKAIDSSQQHVMVRQRIKTYWAESCSAMNVALQAITMEGGVVTNE